MKFEEDIKDFLKVIDFDLCVVDEESVTIHDKCDEDSFNHVLNFPIDFKSNDDLRVFRCNKVNGNYTITIMNTKYPKKPFIKNGIDSFELKWRNKGFSSEGDDIFSSEIFHHGSLYISFIGRSLNENHVSYRKFNHEECVDVLYSIDSEKRKFEIIFNEDKKMERRISIHIPIKDKNQSATLLVEEDKKVVYKQELKDEEIESYMYSLFYKAGNIIMETHEGIKTLDSTIFNRVFDYYDIAKEFIDNMNNSNDSNQTINELFKKYFDSAEFKRSDTWGEDMHKTASEKCMGLKRGDTLLGTSHYERLGRIIKEDFEEDDIEVKPISQGPTKVLKGSNTERLKHMREMIRKDFEED